MVYDAVMNKEIGAGATARVIHVSEGAVVKVFKPPFEDEFVDREYAIAKFAFQSGIATPAPLERLTFQGFPAIRYEYIAGQTLDKQLFRKFWNYSTLMHQFALVHETINALDARSLGLELDQKEWFRTLISASTRIGEVKEKALTALDGLPNGTSLCHGDFSVGNTIINNYGMMVIDWSTGTVGDPAADLANTWLGMGELIPRSRMNLLIRWGSERAIKCYRSNYRPYADRMFAERVDTWMLPVAVAKLGAQEIAGVREENLQVLSEFIETIWGSS